MEFVFDRENNKEGIEDLEIFIEDNKDKLGALMPIMQKTQEIFGYLPLEMLQLISRRTGTPLSEIYGVATFYSQFSFIPIGEYKVSVCLGTACYVKGAQGILEEIEKELDIKHGGTTPDLKFSIIEARCLGDCGLAPVFTINDDVYPHVKKEDIKEILAKYR
ncbi:NADH-quinone oxidoreductase subunit NuoE family protein [Tissierella creatinophila]|uniref:NADP-reducing hydrogenase subunit HndA n=1 Tax=Tissierella creatinophila DSM 6911 TaxID=1123403 RepID=A0A1U7M8X2_TISCR|nr:NAD(P)H-dependent oxidoreductase subunit E [Tissierella creatinophila]OLS03747.1 NADP-reducing hydrogenase subunit HndA [Tissierella creatinophila DSM 6911]